MIKTARYPINFEEYELVKNYETGFVRGQQPDWIYEDIAGGSTTYQTDDGGRVKLSTGTGGSGEGVDLQFGIKGSSASTINFSNFDAFLIDTVINGEDDKSLFSTLIHHYIDGDNNFYMYIDTEDELETKVGGTGHDGNLPFADYGNKKIRTTVVGDVLNDNMWGLRGGMVSQKVPTPNFASANLNLPKFTTADTTADRVLYVYYISLKLFQKS